MASEIYFFMTKEDLLHMLTRVEESIGVKYIENAAYYSKDIPIYDSLTDYEYLGISRTGDHQSESFLVLEKSEELHPEERLQFDGRMRYLVDQSNHSDSVGLWLGGMYRDKFLVCGHMGTISASDKSKRIFNAFRKCIKAQCKYKKGRYYFSDNVKEISGGVRLITISVKSPPEYDLKIEEEENGKS